MKKATGYVGKKQTSCEEAAHLVPADHPISQPSWTPIIPAEVTKLQLYSVDYSENCVLVLVP
jgi:hypothetical protein